MIWFLNPQVILPFGTTEVIHQLSGGEENAVYFHLIGPSILVLNHLTDANSFSYWSEYENPPPIISAQNERTFFIYKYIEHETNILLFMNYDLWSFKDLITSVDCRGITTLHWSTISLVKLFISNKWYIIHFSFKKSK